MLYLLIFALIASQPKKVIEVHKTVVAPQIDGRIESIWVQADSATGFTQLTPYEGKEASEPTTVWVLQDDANLYVAFRCKTPGRKPAVNLGGSEDCVTLYLDTFGNKTTAYKFWVGASGCHSDAMILDDGRNTDRSWDGVWFHGVKVYSEAYEVEIKIPFKTIRYKEGLTEWGINFSRWIYKSQESVYWAPMTQREWLRVSRFGKLKGVQPQVKGYYLELYPIGFVRNDKYSDVTKTYPAVGLNLVWGITPQITIATTVNPDFAQIEADPYTLNLSRYETRLDERRPFFLEGSEIFKPAGFERGSGFYQPIEVFYSRRVGKRLPDGTEIPISFGTKLVGKTSDWELGILGARTEARGEEPTSYYDVIRYRHRVLENSSVGILWAAKEYRGGYNRAFGIDGAIRSSLSQLLVQCVGSNSSGRQGFAFTTGFKGLVKGGNYLFISRAGFITNAFDISEIGYARVLGGERSLLLFGGPFKTYKKGFLRNLFYGIGGGILREPDAKSWSKFVAANLNPNFRNNYGFSLEMNFGQAYEADTSYMHRGINLSCWSGGGRRLNGGFGFWYGYTWNYYRNWLAYQGNNWFWLEYTVLPNVSVSANGNCWVEWNPSGSIEQVTLSMIPRISWVFTPDIRLNLYSQPVTLWGASGLTLNSNRVGFLFSWEIRPKSFLYVALNDYRERQEHSFKLVERIGVVKLKYLWYF